MSGSLKNFSLAGSAIISASQAYDKLGALVGNMKGSASKKAIIDNVHVSDLEVAFPSNHQQVNMGGLVGSLNEYSEIRNSSSAAVIKLYEVVGSYHKIGGLVGITTGVGLQSSIIKNSYFKGNIVVKVTRNGSAGGIVGHHSNGTIINTYSTADILYEKANSTTNIIYLGGIVGTTGSGATLKNSYATGSITASSTGKFAASGIAASGCSGNFCRYNYYNLENGISGFDTDFAIISLNSHNFGYTDLELKKPANSDVSVITGLIDFSLMPSTATDTEIGCIARGGTWTISPDTCTGASADDASIKIYDGWSTDNWDFGTSTQLPALKFTDSDELIPGQTR